MINKALDNAGRAARPCPGWRNTGVRGRIGSINEPQFAQRFLESARTPQMREIITRERAPVPCKHGRPLA